MDRNDQQAITDLFEKLADVERKATPRDSDAEAFIRDRIASQPGAPYYMAQTIVVQEQALNAAQARIEELESRASSSGGLFGGLFGDRQQPRSAARFSGGRGADGFGRPRYQDQQGGGGFLAGAAQTAMGVAGGVLLANAIGGLFGGDEAAADETSSDDGADDAGDSGDFDGGDFGGDM
jgi:uncharacterized protein